MSAHPQVSTQAAFNHFAVMTAIRNYHSQDYPQNNAAAAALYDCLGGNGVSLDQVFASHRASFANSQALTGLAQAAVLVVIRGYRSQDPQFAQQNSEAAADLYDCVRDGIPVGDALRNHGGPFANSPALAVLLQAAQAYQGLGQVDAEYSNDDSDDDDQSYSGGGGGGAVAAAPVHPAPAHGDAAAAAAYGPRAQASTAYGGGAPAAAPAAAAPSPVLHQSFSPADLATAWRVSCYQTAAPRADEARNLHTAMELINMGYLPAGRQMLHDINGRNGGQMRQDPELGEIFSQALALVRQPAAAAGPLASGVSVFVSQPAPSAAPAPQAGPGQDGPGNCNTQ